MFEFFNKFFNKQSSKDIAKERLKLVLIHDRANVSPELLELIKNEILNAIQKYIVIDDKLLEIQITRTPSEQKGEFVPALIANIPIKSVKKSEIMNDEAEN
ncbi:cell division topological specificity factor MinE [Caldicellulosiruptor changbaiensis]|uniref:Cell division topological specificity factor n=1 Tax=Caldicellulosiruptor changbaiensis TaxID=1222016 RepID=A0A3T0D5P5_9FIRM|nr:cell division topological specificity factor MinE [Caldicellulosiruptor changbaiensis]AZT90400.1 cell division topological specificity factor MinE [Caldicellulosiruptor changbaiensis]